MVHGRNHLNMRKYQNMMNVLLYGYYQSYNVDNYKEKIFKLIDFDSKKREYWILITIQIQYRYILE